MSQITAELGLTRRILELLSEPRRQPILRVQTRSPLVARDIDLFLRFESIRVHMSITTDDDLVRKEFEPMCASIDRRIEALERVALAGIPVGLSICPMLPMKDPESFGKRLARLNPSVCFTGRFHKTKKEFQANTGAKAIDIASKYGWNDDLYDQQVKALRIHLPQINS